MTESFLHFNRKTRTIREHPEEADMRHLAPALVLAAAVLVAAHRDEPAYTATAQFEDV